ncbi:MAG: ABC transporter ATP-binding protein/permease, partial [Eubacteriales bacterium]
AVVLLCCVPLIPISIILVQKVAKKLLHKYWGEYTQLGDSFLENLQGLSTLKIYQADEYKHQEMNQQAERFRKITMRVLTMQLNSISVMDIIAYGGTALGVTCSVLAYGNDAITFAEAIVIILLCSDFFLPMRLLGSFFHIAMNGMAASKKMFTLLELEVEEEKKEFIEDTDIVMRNLGFQYEDGEVVLSGIDMDIAQNSMISIVGESGCGKSTMAGIIAGVLRGYTGYAKIGGKEVAAINQENLLENITVIGLGSYIFKGSVRENLLMGNPDASDARLWQGLEQVNLKQFIQEQEGLDTMLMERGENLSGGQCQRLALARALLHDSRIYIFDESTSNIDVESENEIMELIQELRHSKTIILISHRLANVVTSDTIYVLANGELKEQGTHADLLASDGTYATLWNAQMELELVREGGAYESQI